MKHEVAEWAGKTPAELWELARLCARDAMWAAKAGGHLEAALDYQDPLPATTVRALERLRREAGRGRGDG